MLLLLIAILRSNAGMVERAKANDKETTRRFFFSAKECSTRRGGRRSPPPPSLSVSVSVSVHLSLPPSLSNAHFLMRDVKSIASVRPSVRPCARARSRLYDGLKANVALRECEREERGRRERHLASR